jgi:uncharacterized membrane protein
MRLRPVLLDCLLPLLLLIAGLSYFSVLAGAASCSLPLLIALAILNLGWFGVRYTQMLLLVLTLAGMVVSCLALRVHYDTGTEPCSINEKWDCGIVNHSSYAMIAGVPVAAIGIAGYLLLAILVLKQSRALVLPAALVGLGFALYLTHIEKDVLEVWCLYCVISLALISLITLHGTGWLLHGWWQRRKIDAKFL